MNARDEVKEEIKNRLAIEDVVGSYVDLKRSGGSLKGLCPFHQEKTPSFYVSPARGTYHCFGCGRGGDLFQFVMESEQVQFPEALRRLGEQAGVVIPEREAQRPSLKGRLFEANEAAMRFFSDSLAANEGKRAMEYLVQRGFKKNAIDLFDLGYSPGGREGLVHRLRSAGFDDRTILASGLALQDGEASTPRDRFRSRLMFPIRDASGKISGFGGRILGEGQPKYLNSPQTEVFDKSSVLFGIQLAQGPIRQAGRAVLVEGYLDAVRAHIGGFTNTVASLGTAVTSQQLARLARLGSAIILALDPDPAGQNAAARSALHALVEVMQSRTRSTVQGPVDLRIASLPPEGGDPDDLIRDRPQLWEEALDSAVPALDFHFTRTMQSLDRTTESWRQEAIDRLLPVIQQFAGTPGWQAVWVERLSTETGVDVRLLLGAMPAAGGSRRRTRRSTSGSDIVSQTTARALALDPEMEVEQALMGLLLQVIILPREAAETLRDVQLRRPEHHAILDALTTWQNYDYELFRESLPEDARHVADELRGRAVPLPPEGKLSLAVKLHLVRLQQARVQKQYTRAKELLPNLAVDDQEAAFPNIAALASEKHRLDEDLRHLQKLVVQSSSARNQGTIDHDSGSS